MSYPLNANESFNSSKTPSLLEKDLLLNKSSVFLQCFNHSEKDLL